MTMTHKAKQRKRLDRAFALRPIESLSVDAWADKYRVLAPSVAAMPGAFKTSRIEIARGPMRAMTEPGVTTVTIKSSTQLMKTTVIENLLGYMIHQQPCPILCAFPKVDMVKSFSKERFAAMVRATPVLKAIIGDVTKDRSEESLAFKQFPGGFVALESAGSATNLAARPIRVTLADEVDKMEDLKFEGDPLLLLEERTSTFSDGLHVRCCSPTVDETSRIEKSYNESDMRRAFVACPHCQHEQALDFWKHVSWSKSEDGKEHFPLTATLHCESCGGIVEEDQRRKIMTTEGAVRWYQTRVFTCCGVEQDPVKTRNWQWDDAAQCGYALCTECNKRAVSNVHAGFTASKLYSPFITVVSLAEQWIKSKDDLAQRQVFYNTALGLAFSAHATRQVESHILADRREKFPAVLPKEILLLTCGVDDQADRLEVHVIGWAHPEEAWSVHYEILPGDPSKPEIWSRLDELLKSSWESAWGVQFRIRATCIDSGGHHTEMAYRFCQPKASRNIWAIKGSSWAKSGSPVWPVPKSFKTRRKSDLGFKPHIIAVDSAKDHLRNMLLTEEHGPGFFHIPQERDVPWLEQLTAERQVFEKKAGITTRKWHLPRGRTNEAFDTLVYAYAAKAGLAAVRGLKMEKLAADMPRLVAAHTHGG